MTSVTRPQLYLITPRLTAAEPFLGELASVLAMGEVACVRVRLAESDPVAAKKILQALAKPIQESGAALLIDDDARLAARIGADGVHLTRPTSEVLDEALHGKGDRIVGVGALTTRHACMEAGESDIDYLMFGGPDPTESFEHVLEWAHWWAEIFNLPCVAYAATLEEAPLLAKSGAEFIAVEKALWDEPKNLQKNFLHLQALLEQDFGA